MNLLKMNNLLFKLLEIYNNSETWNYYSLENLRNPFKLPIFENSKEFIKEFLDYSGKTKNIYNVLEKIEEERNLHIVTNYFLGILFYENLPKIKKYIDQQIKKYTPPVGAPFNISFKYFWFLTCFYHDVGYYYEKNVKCTVSLDKIKSELNIENNLSKFVGVPRIYQNVYKNYFKYRLEKFNVNDHGIIGGLLFFDKLHKIYKYFQEQNSYITGIVQDTFTYKNLVWSKSMLQYFKLISSVICVHNIWFINKTNKDYIATYKEYQLDKLILSNYSSIISVNKYPLFNLLCLVDSIEPTKRFGIDFLKKVNIDFFGKNKIIVSSNSPKDSEVINWFYSILQLSDWIKLKIEKINDFEIKIIL